MHCPNCGNQSELDQKFCRTCGFNLEPVGKLIQTSSDEHNEAKLDRAEREKRIIRRMVSWMMWGLLVLLIGVVLSVVNKQFQLGHVFGLIATLVILGGVSLTTYGVLDALRCGGFEALSPKAKAASDEGETESAPTTRELEGRFPIPIGSVTERTTQLIGADSEQRS